MIDCVNIATAHCFAGNLIAAQHRLRYQEVIAKEDWSNIYVAAEMEFRPIRQCCDGIFYRPRCRGQGSRGLSVISDNDSLYAVRRVFLSVFAGTASQP